MRVLICGGGVIGASIAYFLSRRGVQAVVIERAGVACAASGKSGGFLALDWCDGSPLAPLARRSFALHADLAAELGNDWGYRRLDTYSGYAYAREIGRRGADAPAAWLAGDVVVDRRLGATDTTAQVHPGAFTAALMRAAQAQGAELRLGEVTGVRGGQGGERIRGVEVAGETVEGDAVVIAMGPWSLLATRWLLLPAVFGLKGHSLVFETGAAIPAQALFLEYQEASGAMLSPELFPRADGTTYVCAVSSESPLPLDPAAVVPDAGAIERLQALCSHISPALARSKVLARQACFRPVTEDGLPLIGAVPGVAGAYVATGHSVWGILNAPATGEAIADLIVDGASRAVDLSPFDPARLPPFEAARLRTEAVTNDD
jgi:glycine/D-amino acid oxidase-like deaminating enzyme